MLDLGTATPDDLYVYGTTSEGVIISGVNDFIYANVFSIENIELRYFHNNNELDANYTWQEFLNTFSDDPTPVALPYNRFE